MSIDNSTLIECYEDASLADGGRVFFVAGIGTVLCSVGVLFNTILLIVFSRMSSTRSHLIYLMCLCCYDILVEISYMVRFITSFICLSTQSLDCLSFVIYVLSALNIYELNLTFPKTSQKRFAQYQNNPNCSYSSPYLYYMITTISIFCTNYGINTQRLSQHVHRSSLSFHFAILIPNSVYIIIAASAERFILSRDQQLRRFTMKQRLITICITLLLAICVKVGHSGIRHSSTAISVLIT
ncbi:unnamed protein product [Anisakis simplex]|uniref:G_PROTEIN_RECEP_F1_2 domain-containing protein n=1 Tax=Anisakis simplex TaxID=6269 RepID=A0A0M3IZA7_ANISI|nr:unnamed protein product [Anisakis simplex]